MGGILNEPQPRTQMAAAPRSVALRWTGPDVDACPVDDLHATARLGALGAEDLLRTAPEALLVVRDGVVAWANDRAAALAGADPTGAAVREMIVGWREAPEDAVPFEAAVGGPHGELPVQVRVGPAAPDGTRVVALRDARELLAGRDALVAMEEAEAKYQTLVEQIPAIVYVDVEGRGTTYVSPQIQAILGVSPETYCADPDVWHELLHPEDRGRVEAEYESFLEGSGGDLGDYRMCTPDGRVVWIRDRAVTVRDEAGRVLLEHGVMFDITELKEAEAVIQHMAFHDGLTGLANRARFEDALTMAINRAERNHHAVAVLYLDLDNFKLVNDSLGHAAGDQLLIQLADRLRVCTRETDLVARQGGDEFLLLLADAEHGEITAAAQRVAARIEEALVAPFDLMGTEFHVRGSVGISCYPNDATDGSALLKNADAAMYQAKRYEPGGHVFFAGDADEAMAKLSYATRLRRAIAEERWVLHYQPVVDLGDGSVIGAEALIRWQEASGGLVPPGEFIPVAEELGMIEAIGDWVIDEVAMQQRAWIDAGLDLDVSFNLSPRQLFTPRLAEHVLDKLRSAGVDPQRITAEITESTAMADPDHTQRILTELRSWGMRLALDDFGTGYSSLARLKHMPVDVLKIDQAFVRNVDADPRLAGMVRAMIQVAQSLDMIPLAEGIETRAEWEFLRANGCRLAQGFWFAHPVPAAELPALATRPGGLVPRD
jgi:diguanylate cyclase (GGDEF)-like protein/PAS domain S-box-containing protein